MSQDRADAGAPALSAFTDGLRVSRAVSGGAPQTLTTMGHSYGSLVVAKAAVAGADVDAVAVVGSPGLGFVTTPDALRGRLYVSEAEGDNAVADSGWFTADPSGVRDGRHVFESDGGVDPYAVGDLPAQTSASHGHSQHYDRGTESLRSLGYLVLGQTERVSGGPQR